MRTLSHRGCGDCSAGLRRVRNKICPISNPGPDQKSSRLNESRLVGPSSLPRQIFQYFNFNSQAPSWRLLGLDPADGFAKTVTHWLKWLKT